MATITKRKYPTRTRWQAKVRLQGHPPQSASFDRLTDARAWAAATETAMRERRYLRSVEATRHTLGDLVSQYREQVLPSKSPSTQRPQDMQLRWWAEQIGGYCLADCTPAVISEQARKLGETRSPATVNRYLAALSHAFSVAHREWHWVESNPVASVRRMKEPRGRTRFLSDEERTRLLAACKAPDQHPWLYSIVILALSTGMRAGELLGLTWDRVDLERGRITLEQTKNGEVRVVPVPGPALELLKAHKATRRKDTDLLWPGRSKPPRPMVLWKPWAAAVEAAGLEDFRFHDLRHSAASYLLMSGASIGELAEVLGHKTLQMVKRYSHLSEAHTAGLVERMAQQFLADREE